MPFSIPPRIYERDSRSVIRRLLANHGYLAQSGTAWFIRRPGNRQGRSAVEVPSRLVEAMRARGHLVERPEGGLVLHAADRQGFLAQRPERPGEDATRPGFNEAESPLAWLWSRKLVNETQLLAGERLRADFERASLERRTTANWDADAAAGSRAGYRAAELTDSQLAARQRLERAIAAVGPELASILVQVCCLSAGLEQAERLLELPKRSGKAVLGLALTGLARHYGLLGQHGRERTAIGLWAIDGYKPKVSPQAAG